MSTAVFENFQGPNNTPANFPYGITTTGKGSVNDIGIPGELGFGVGICPGPLPSYIESMDGTWERASNNHGNYQCYEGSVMVWVPACFMKWGTGANGLVVNDLDVLPRSAFATVAEANAAGYFLDRAFYDGGIEQPGFFYDKFRISNNGGIASSLPNGIPLTTGGGFHVISALNGAPPLNYGGMQAACKTRGQDFFSATIFQDKCIARLAYAHARASINNTYCSWFDGSGVTNFPKGCNNDALGDINDGALTFVAAGDPTYPAKPKTGSANNLAKTTHNGQACGIADINGCTWKVAFGLTSDGVNFYALKTSKRMKDLTGGSGLTTDLFGAAGIVENYDNLGPVVGVVAGSNAYTIFGSASQVFADATSGTAWQAMCAGLPIAEGGSNYFGNDCLWDYRPNEMCPIVGAYWGSGSDAGVWALYLGTVRAGAYGNVGGRSALYL